MKTQSTLWRAVLGVTAVLFGFLVAYLVTVEQLGTAAPGQGPSMSRPQAGTEVLAIFVASSTCGASEYPGLKEAIRDIRQSLRHKADVEEQQLVSVGVALDQDPMSGIEFLSEFGPFDEVLSGGSWLTTGSLAFIVRDLPSRREIPQLVLVEREVAMEEGRIASVRDRLVGRKVGAAAIVSFANLLATESATQTK